MQTTTRKSLAELTKSDFEPHVKSSFKIEHRQGSFDATLVRVDGYPHLTPPFAKRESFSLLFFEPTGMQVPNWVYNLRHPKMGLIEGVLVTQVFTPPELRQQADATGQDTPSLLEVVFS